MSIRSAAAIIGTAGILGSAGGMGIYAASASIISATQAHAAPAKQARCTQADGLCLVVEYITVQPDGTHKVWTCYLTRLPAPEGHGVKFPGYTCVLPGQTP